MSMSIKNDVKTILKLLNVPGAIVMLKSKKKESFLLTYRYSDLENKIPVDVCDKFRIGSNTKMFTGIVFLQLYQEGLINLDEPVSNYLLGLTKKYKNLTIREVGMMRSGIPDYFGTPEVQAEYEENPYRNWLSDELYAVGATQKQLFPPGERFNYSKINRK